MTNIRVFYLDISSFLEVKFSIYLNRRVFVMKWGLRGSKLYRHVFVMRCFGSLASHRLSREGRLIALMRRLISLHRAKYNLVGTNVPWLICTWHGPYSVIAGDSIRGQRMVR